MRTWDLTEIEIGGNIWDSDLNLRYAAPACFWSVLQDLMPLEVRTQSYSDAGEISFRSEWLLTAFCAGFGRKSHTWLGERKAVIRNGGVTVSLVLNGALGGWINVPLYLIHQPLFTVCVRDFIVSFLPSFLLHFRSYIFSFRFFLSTSSGNNRFPARDTKWVLPEYSSDTLNPSLHYWCSEGFGEFHFGIVSQVPEFNIQAYFTL